MLENIEGIFFDFDGVLFDFEPLHLQSWQQLLQEKGLDPASLRVDEIMGISDIDIAEKVVHDHDLSEEVDNLILEKDALFLDEIYNFSQDVSEIDRTLYHFKDKLLSIVSSSSRDFILHMLKKHKLDHYFSFIVGCYETEKHKPDPTPYLYALKKSTLLPQEIVVIEDSEPGIEAAERAGLSVIWYTKYLQKKKKRKKALPTCSSFSQLKDLIQ